MPKGDTLLKVENLKAYYASKKGLVRAVDDVSFVIREGECVGLLGESGCGKTSLALSIMGFFERVARFAAGTSDSSLRRQFDNVPKGQSEDRPGVQGKVFFRGVELTSLPEEEFVKLRGREISMIPQGLGHALNPMFSVGMQTGEPVQIHEEQVRLIELKKKVLEYLASSDSGMQRTRLVQDPACFSGGEAQRILIAMSLIAGPYLVIADEPTSALDVTIQHQILNVLRMIRDEFAVSLFLISHDAGVVAELADKVAVMYAGKIMELGDAIQMFHHPSHPYTMGLMASYPTIAMMRMKAGGKRPILRGIRGDPPDLTAVPAGCPFHPRCNYVVDKCKSQIPEYREAESGHWIRCHRWGEIERE